MALPHQDYGPSLHILQVADDVLMEAHWDSGATRSIISEHTWLALCSQLTPSPSPEPLEPPLRVSGCYGTGVWVTQAALLRVRVHPLLPAKEETFLIMPGEGPTLLSAAHLGNFNGIFDPAAGTWTLTGPNQTTVTLKRTQQVFTGNYIPYLPGGDKPLLPSVVIHMATTSNEWIQDKATDSLLATDTPGGEPTPSQMDTEALWTSYDTLKTHLFEAQEHQVPIDSALRTAGEKVLHDNRDAFLMKDGLNDLPTPLPGDLSYTIQLRNTTVAPQFTTRNRLVPEHLKEQIKTHVADLLAKGKISLATTNIPTVSWASFHAKKNAEGLHTSLRMTVDYRVANQHIKSDEYPLPLIDTVLTHCSQYSVYCVLDLSEGYYNLLCNCTVTKALLAFKCGDGKLYVWNVAPQGAKKYPRPIPSCNGTYPIGSHRSRHNPRLP